MRYSTIRGNKTKFFGLLIDTLLRQKKQTEFKFCFEKFVENSF